MNNKQYEEHMLATILTDFDTWQRLMLSNTDDIVISNSGKEAVSMSSQGLTIWTKRSDAD